MPLDSSTSTPMQQQLLRACAPFLDCRWRLFSLAQEDSMRSWKVEPFQLVEGAARRGSTSPYLHKSISTACCSHCWLYSPARCPYLAIPATPSGQGRSQLPCGLRQRPLPCTTHGYCEFLHSAKLFKLQSGFCRWIPPPMTMNAGGPQQTAAQRGGELLKDKPLPETQQDRSVGSVCRH